MGVCVCVCFLCTFCTLLVFFSFFFCCSFSQLHSALNQYLISSFKNQIPIRIKSVPYRNIRRNLSQKHTQKRKKRKATQINDQNKNTMASNKEIVVNSMNYGKQNGTNEINQKNRNKRLFTWKTVALICVINGKCSLDQCRIVFAPFHWVLYGFSESNQFLHLLNFWVEIEGVKWVCEWIRERNERANEKKIIQMVLCIRIVEILFSNAPFI